MQSGTIMKIERIIHDEILAAHKYERNRYEAAVLKSLENFEHGHQGMGLLTSEVAWIMSDIKAQLEKGGE